MIGLFSGWRPGLPRRGSPWSLCWASHRRARKNDIQSLSDKVDRLQQELSDVERQVYNGQVPAGQRRRGGR